MRARLFLVVLAACDQGATSAPRQSPPTPPPSPPHSPQQLPPPQPPIEVIPSQQAPEQPRPPIPADLAYYVRDLGAGTKLFATIETSRGTLTCELYADKAPMTVANFIGLATGQKSWLDPKTGSIETGKPFYDGLTFHRVIPGFMIQGGDPMGNGTGGPGYSFDDEIWNGAYFGPGVLGMANAGTRDGHGTNGSQFFIMEGDRPDLGARHTVFGTCAPLGVIQAIARVKTDTMDKPHDPISIIRVKISKV